MDRGNETSEQTISLGPGPLEGEGFVLRPWSEADRESLVRHADDRLVWRNLTDRFPHPYTLQDADAWLHRQGEALRQERVHDFAIAVKGEACGGIGILPFADLARRGAEVGYWLGRARWGRGIATRVLRHFTRHVFDVTDLVRLQANVLEWNMASCRVLEKAGYTREGRLRKSMIKDGALIDAFLYARLRDGLEEVEPGASATRPASGAASQRLS